MVCVIQRKTHYVVHSRILSSQSSFSHYAKNTLLYAVLIFAVNLFYCENIAVVFIFKKQIQEYNC